MIQKKINSAITNRWKCIGEKVWKPLKVFTNTVWLKWLTMSQLLFHSLHLKAVMTSAKSAQFLFFYCFVLTLSERGLYLITTLTCADLPQR